MKKLYTSVCMIIIYITGLAQSPTTVNNATGCIPFATFTSSDEGFSSPSIYSSDNDVSFFYDTIRGVEKEQSGIANRQASLISPIYSNPTFGQSTVGFRYEAPIGTQYRVRIISGVIGAPLEVIASTANGPIFTTLPSTSGNICISITDADLTAGRPIRFEFTFRANGTQMDSIIFDNFSFVAAAGPLPVTFEGFVARKTDLDMVKLLWNVGQEINVKGYKIESSIDGITFNEIASVSANRKSVYTYDLAQKLNQTTFFRIRSIDVNGNSKLTPIIRVFSKENTQTTIQAYPIPERDVVTIQHKKAEPGTIISLFNGEGKLIKQRVALANSFQTQLFLEGLTGGIYFIRYADAKDETQNLKILKN